MNAVLHFAAPVAALWIAGFGYALAFFLGAKFGQVAGSTVPRIRFLVIAFGTILWPLMVLWAALDLARSVVRAMWTP